MTKSPRLLVVGAGQAALQLASSVRDAGYDGGVTLVGDEEVPPYQRPPLSKGMLTGATSAAATSLRADDFYRDRRIDLLLGRRVERVDRGPGGSGAAVCSDGGRLVFDRLVLATGAAARRLRVPGAGADGVVVLRTLADAANLRARLQLATDVVVVGAGFVGVEVAATAASLGKRVTVVEVGPTILGRGVGPSTAEWLHAHHASAGIDFRVGTGVAEVCVRDGRVTGVRTTADELVAAQVVVVGIGAEPRTELAEQLGLDIDGGIVVDGRGLASDGVTLAVGDCAVLPDPTPWTEGASHRVRLESVDHAVEHARSAARVVVGLEKDHEAVPWFWSDQGTAKLQIVGLRRATDTAVSRPSPPGAHTVGHYRNGRLVAVEAINCVADFVALRGLLSAGGDVPPDVLADPEADIRRFARQARSGGVVSGG